jgi:trehalose 6-phosphate synthase/phosphatase
MVKPNITGLINKYRSAKSRCILLDYDGTLVSFKPVPDAVRLPENISEILLRLIDVTGNQVYIITGRSYYDADKIFSHIPVNIIAEHGAIIRENGKWLPGQVNSTGWKVAVTDELNDVTAKCPGSIIEEKLFSVAWHYRNADQLKGNLLSRELIGSLSGIIDKFDLKIIDGNKVVEIMSVGVGKGKAVKKIFEERSFDFVLSAGDDKTDEEMFEYLSTANEAYTIKVGNGDSSAMYNISGIDELLALLKELIL